MMPDRTAGLGGAMHNPMGGPKVAAAREALNQIREKRRNGEQNDARRLALGAMDLWHLSAPLVRLIGNMRWPASQYPVICERLAEIGRSTSGLMREECAVALRVFGADDAAMELLNLPVETSASSNRSPLQDFLYSNTGSKTDRPTARFDDSVIVEAMRPGSKRCLLVFPGTFNGLGIPMPLFDSLIAPLDTSVMYIRDPQRSLCLTGIHSHSSTLDEGFAFLRKRMETAAVTDIYTLGASSGGVAAIRYGLALGARGIMTMSSPINLQHEFMSKDGRIHAVYRWLYEQLTPPDYDLRSFVAAAAPPQRIFIYHADGHQQDVAHARSITGLPGVEVRPVVNYGGHNVLRPLMERGEMVPAIRELLEHPAP